MAIDLFDVRNVVYPVAGRAAASYGLGRFRAP
jgi:hypothetical protein